MTQDGQGPAQVHPKWQATVIIINEKTVDGIVHTYCIYAVAPIVSRQSIALKSDWWDMGAS